MKSHITLLFRCKDDVLKTTWLDHLIFSILLCHMTLFTRPLEFPQMQITSTALLLRSGNDFSTEYPCTAENILSGIITQTKFWNDSSKGKSTSTVNNSYFPSEWSPLTYYMAFKAARSCPKHLNWEYPYLLRPFRHPGISWSGRTDSVLLSWHQLRMFHRCWHIRTLASGFAGAFSWKNSCSLRTNTHRNDILRTSLRKRRTILRSRQRSEDGHLDFLPFLPAARGFTVDSLTCSNVFSVALAPIGALVLCTGSPLEVWRAALGREGNCSRRGPREGKELSLAVGGTISALVGSEQCSRYVVGLLISLKGQHIIWLAQKIVLTLVAR